MSSRWLTKEDVVNDLVDIRDLDNYCVVGERPPPPRRSSSITEDEIMNQFYGGQHSRAAEYDGVDSTPDLYGIQQMLQLVQEKDGEGSLNKQLNFEQERNGKSIITIKKVTNIHKKPVNTLNNNTVMHNELLNKTSVNIDDSTKTDSYQSTNCDNTLSFNIGKPFYNNCKLDNAKSNFAAESNAVSSNFSKDDEFSLKNAGNPMRIQPITSDLNPNVAEFVPKTSSITNLNVESEPFVPNNQPTTPKQYNVNGISKDTNHESGQNKNGDDDTKVGSHIDINGLTQDEIERISAKLKSTILDKTKNDLANKRARNIAMAALLKLSTLPSDDKKARPLLLTPDYFQSAPVSCDDDTQSLSMGGIQRKEGDNETSDLKKSHSIQTLTSKNPIEDQSKMVHPEVKKSIDKVQNWLHSEEKEVPKPRGPILSPVTFKKKDVPKPVSQADSKSSSSDLSQSIEFNLDDTRFESIYQNLLDNIKKKENESKDIWEKLESDLKTRDEAIKQNLEQNQNGAEIVDKEIQKSAKKKKKTKWSSLA